MPEDGGEEVTTLDNVAANLGVELQDLINSIKALGFSIEFCCGRHLNIMHGEDFMYEVEL